jgi:hypothetical protein
MSGSPFGGEVDDLGVAAALEVEHAAVGPAVLVVADEPRSGIGRERGLAGARQPEEQRRVARRPMFAEQCMESTPCFGSM